MIDRSHLYEENALELELPKLKVKSNCSLIYENLMWFEEIMNTTQTLEQIPIECPLGTRKPVSDLQATTTELKKRHFSELNSTKSQPTNPTFYNNKSPFKKLQIPTQLTTFDGAHNTGLPSEEPITEKLIKDSSSGDYMNHLMKMNTYSEIGLTSNSRSQ